MDMRFLALKFDFNIVPSSTYGALELSELKSYGPFFMQVRTSGQN
jgi:hypothetical protein